MSPAKVERIIHVGDFSMNSDVMVASDPCFRETGMAGQVQVAPCEQGLWHAFVVDDTAHTYKLICISSSANPDLADWTILLGESLNVETCQAGLFDASRYRIDEDSYQKICDMTTREAADSAVGKAAGLEAWCFDAGVVSGTATEEGTHYCYTMTNASGIVCGVAVEFYKSYTEWSAISLRKLL